MNNKSHFFLKVTLIIFVLCISCKKAATEAPATEPTIAVTVTTIDTAAVKSFTELNATTTYLVKNTIKANTTGYLVKVNVKSNDFVKKGQLLFAVETREAKVLGNTINKIDPTLKFGGAVNLKSTANGFASAVNVQQGDYVQEGDALGVINDANSFAIVLSLPYELRKRVNVGKVLKVILPDGTEINAKVDSFMPTVDPASQTQNVVLKILSQQTIPENLIVKVRIDKTSGSGAISLPKAAVLSDETETEFWIMKMINADTAVKIPIKKGMETDSRIEITSPKLNFSDKILITGNYGVSDTIKVEIKNH